MVSYYPLLFFGGNISVRKVGSSMAVRVSWRILCVMGELVLFGGEWKMQVQCASLKKIFCLILFWGEWPSFFWGGGGVFPPKLASRKP